MVEEVYKSDVFAERLKELGLEKGIGQNKLARELGLSNASISYWENEKQEPTASALYKLASYFGGVLGLSAGTSRIQIKKRKKSVGTIVPTFLLCQHVICWHTLV